MDANGNRLFALLTWEITPFFGGQRVLSEQGRMLQPGRNTGFSFILILFGKWKSYRGVLLLLSPHFSGSFGARNYGLNVNVL